MDLKKKIDDFNETCPLLELMANKSMKERHWDRIAKTTSFTFDFESENFMLRNIMEAPLLKSKEDIEVHIILLVSSLEKTEMFDPILLQLMINPNDRRYKCLIIFMCLYIIYKIFLSITLHSVVFIGHLYLCCERERHRGKAEASCGRVEHANHQLCQF